MTTIQHEVPRTEHLISVNAELRRELVERGRVEGTLRESLQMLQGMFESTREAIVSADCCGNITSFNRAAEALLGYEASEVVGRPLTALMPERYHEAHLQGFHRFLASGQGRVMGKTVELAARKKDGTEVPVEFSVSSWQTAGKTFATAFLRDISERKRAAEAAEASAKELEAFSYSVSHDLRAPLRAMNGFSRILLQDFASQLPEQARHYLQAIRENAQGMGRLIDDLLDFSRLSRQPLKKQCVATAELVGQALALVRDHEESRHVEVRLGELPVCQADPGLLNQVFANLLGNALKYTRGRDKAVVEVGYGDDGAFFVKDNGVGFDMRYANKLFGVFQRLHRAEDYEGTGVGLAIVQRIVHRHGGRVWAEAEVDRGATFFFTLGNDACHD